ncbi:MAG: flavin reductase family protein [Clostridia bacterium]|nr:flavin reductase family protein [Clostridia bacterium]
MKTVAYNEYLKEAMDQLQKGAFLTVKEGDRLNTMTIGWGSIGYIWRIPVFLVLVRYSRYTYDLLEKSKEFTVSIPIKNEFKKELAFCGTKSGKDVDKFKEANLGILPAMTVNTPVIDKCGLYYECRVVYQQAMEPALVFSPKIQQILYPQKDYHVLYFGEIKACYINEEYF